MTKAPLRFAMVTTFYPPYNFGGDGMGILRLAQALVRRGHSVTVIHDGDAYITLAGRAPSAGFADDGVEVVTLRSQLGAVSNLLTQQTGRPVVHGARIKEVLDAGRFDVTVFNNISLVGGPGILRYGVGATIYLAHEHWLVCPSHVLWRHGREVCTGKECLRCVLSYRRPPQLWRYTGLLERELRHVDRFVAMSEFSKAKHKEFGFSRDMTVVPYFLPDADDAPVVAADASPHDRPYFLFVGRLEKIKGLDDVLPVFDRFDRADLLIAGDGEYTATLKAIAGDNPRIKFLGRVTPTDLSRYYRHAAALLVPSVCFETFGIIIIEAFRQGTPVVARRIGPFPELLDHAGAGDLFDSPEQLEAALHQYLDDPDRRARLSAAAVKAFKETWSETAVIPRFMQVVSEARIASEMRD